MKQFGKKGKMIRGGKFGVEGGAWRGGDEAFDDEINEVGGRGRLDYPARQSRTLFSYLICTSINNFCDHFR